MSSLKTKKLQSIAKEFEKEGLSTDGCILKCSVCDVEISLDAKHQRSKIIRHLPVSRHKELMARKNRSRQQLISESFQSASENLEAKSKFNVDLTAAFIRSGIPLFKLNSPAMKEFLAKYTTKHIPDESTLRKSCLKPLYEETVAEVRSAINDYSVYFILHETTDVRQRCVLNVLVGSLSGKPSKPMLLKMFCLEETNHSA